MRFFCQICPYVHEVETPITKVMTLKKKEEEDVRGGEKEWENVDQTDAACPHCDNKRAYYQQIQIRSADEPMTTFYKCTKCHRKWREG